MVQTCPNCKATHDVRVYVTGQRVLCKCGIRFEVRRTDVSSARLMATGGSEQPPAPAASMSPEDSLELGPTVVHGAPEDKGAPSRVAIPGYELLELIGRGGMGEVWRARQASLGRMVAVKVLPPKLAQDREFVQRFEKESDALASLNHPNIIQIIDRGVVAEHYYFVMEYVAGRSLREVMTGQRLAPAEALRIVAAVCKAIDYAHEHHIVHRDLKPENILVDERGNVKVADFGLAGIRGSELRLTATSVAMGTVNYMAPEQRRDARSVDHRADIYSLGVVLYELLTGDLPVGRFKLPSEKVSGLDRRIDEIVARSLEQDPEARFHSAARVGLQIEQIVGSGARWVPSDDTLPDGPRALGDRGSAVARGFRGLKIALMVVGGFAVVGGVVRLWPAPSNGTNTNGPKKVAVVPPPNTDGELFAHSEYVEEGGVGRLVVRFGEGREELNAHAGHWRFADGSLHVEQAGSATSPGKLKLIPRAYVAHRYFSADDLVLEVDMLVRRLGEDVPVEADAQQFGELALRIKDLQISAFAIPEVGMRLGWRYFTPDGVEVAGNSARDLETMVEDEVPVPKERFRVKLSLRRRNRNTVDVEAFVSGQRFAHKTLVGLEGQVGKVAVGCRNLHCEFDNLEAAGKVAPRPKRGDEGTR